MALPDQLETLEAAHDLIVRAVERVDDTFSFFGVQNHTPIDEIPGMVGPPTYSSLERDGQQTLQYTIPVGGSASAFHRFSLLFVAYNRQPINEMRIDLPTSHDFVIGLMTALEAKFGRPAKRSRARRPILIYGTSTDYICNGLRVSGTDLGSGVGWGARVDCSAPSRPKS